MSASWIKTGEECKICGFIAGMDLSHDCIEYLKSQIYEFKCEEENSDAVRKSMNKILTDIANVLKGPPPELIQYSWHDLAEIVAKQTMDAGVQIAQLRTELAAANERADKFERLAHIAAEKYVAERERADREKKRADALQDAIDAMPRWIGGDWADAIREIQSNPEIKEV